MLMSELSSFTNPETYHREFWNWRQKATRRISEIFGKESLQLSQFLETRYLKPSLASHRAFGESEVSKRQIAEIVDRFMSFLASLTTDIFSEALDLTRTPDSEITKKVFISHSSKDSNLSKEVTNLLEAIGVPSSVIFNSSMPGYGVKPGEKWPDSLQEAISTEGVVISLLSENYFKSAVCLCEMGATWVLSKAHYPIVIPPLTFKRIKGVMPTIHGIMIYDSIWWSELKEELEKIFELTPIPATKWESKKKDILERIEKLLPVK